MVIPVIFVTASAFGQAGGPEAQEGAFASLRAIQTRASGGVTTTYRQTDSKSGEESLCRLYLKEGKFRVDRIITKLAHGESGWATDISITKVDESGNRTGKSGSARLSSKLTPEAALDRLTSPYPLRMVMSTDSSMGAFSHVAWRYGWDSYRWMGPHLAKRSGLAAHKEGSRYRVESEIGSDILNSLTIESGSQPRLTERRSWPKPGALNPLVELCFREETPTHLVFTMSNDYSKIPEEMLRREDTPDHKVPRGKESRETSYEILDEKFGPIDDSIFEINLAAGSLVTDSESRQSSRLIDGRMQRINDRNEIIPDSSKTTLAVGLTALASIAVIGGGLAAARRKRP